MSMQLTLLKPNQKGNKNKISAKGCRIVYNTDTIQKIIVPRLLLTHCIIYIHLALYTMNALQKSQFFGGQATLSSSARGSAVRAPAGRLVVQAGRIVRGYFCCEYKYNHRSWYT